MSLLTSEERLRIRYHLGYPLLNTGTDFRLRLPYEMSLDFSVERAMEELPDAAIPKVREVLGRCEDTDSNLFAAQGNLEAMSVGSIHLNPKEMTQRGREYRRWTQRLQSILAVPFGPGATSGGSPLNALRS